MEPVENYALSALNELVGTWRIAIRTPGQDTFVDGGTLSIDWAEGRSFIVMRTETAPGGAPSSICMVGRDQDLGVYQMLYFDERGVSRFYHMTFHSRVWKLWRSNPGFSQKFSATLMPDGRQFKGTWRKSVNGEDWVQDFEVAYTREAETQLQSQDRAAE